MVKPAPHQPRNELFQPRACTMCSTIASHVFVRENGSEVAFCAWCEKFHMDFVLANLSLWTDSIERGVVMQKRDYHGPFRFGFDLSKSNWPLVQTPWSKVPA